MFHLLVFKKLPCVTFTKSEHGFDRIKALVYALLVKTQILGIKTQAAGGNPTMVYRKVSQFLASLHFFLQASCAALSGDRDIAQKA